MKVRSRRGARYDVWSLQCFGHSDAANFTGLATAGAVRRRSLLSHRS